MTSQQEHLPSWAREQTTPSYQSQSTPFREEAPRPLRTEGGALKTTPNRSPPSRRTRLDPVIDDDSNDSCCEIDSVLCTFMLFHFIAALVAISALVCNVYVFWTNDLSWDSYRDATIRLYAALLCLAIVCVESDWKFIIRRVKFLESWIFRGFSYAFLGFITGTHH